MYHSVTPRVGIVDSPEVAGYHELIKKLEKKNEALKLVYNS